MVTVYPIQSQLAVLLPEPILLAAPSTVLILSGCVTTSGAT